MGGFSLIHWIIVAVFIMLLFGGNRFSSMMGDVAKGLKSFKQGLADEEDKQRTAVPPQQPTQQYIPPQQPAAQQPPIDLTARPVDPASPPPPPPAGDDGAR